MCENVSEVVSDDDVEAVGDAVIFGVRETLLVPLTEKLKEAELVEDNEVVADCDSVHDAESVNEML